MKPLLVTSGEPAGIGPDLCLALAKHALPIVVVGDKALLAQRALQLGLPVQLIDYEENKVLSFSNNRLNILHVPCTEVPVAGQLNPRNASYVIRMLTLAVERCLHKEFSALVTAPVHKGVINEGGIPFSGHTEFLAEQCQTETVVMMLVCKAMRVALLTTHLPLRDVAYHISKDLLRRVIYCLHYGLQKDFGIAKPRLYIAGLNPHAGESGYLGREDLDIISPVIAQLQQEGLNITGPLPADTLFTPPHLTQADVFLTMYHDQGLPVLKYAGFGEAVNVTLGLPIIRTSVDHGTALNLAGKGLAETSSLSAAIALAATMVRHHEHH